MLNNANPAVKMNCVKRSNKDVAKSYNSLLMTNGEIAKFEKFVKLNEELAAANKELDLIRAVQTTKQEAKRVYPHRFP